jgi:hypothetical protein
MVEKVQNGGAFIGQRSGTGQPVSVITIGQLGEVVFSKKALHGSETSFTAKGRIKEASWLIIAA